MEKNMNEKVSVAMATYNGEKYIKKQIESIMDNLKENDELIISDDGSTDNTLEIIKKMMNFDKRIRLINGPKNGIKKNFENAIIYTTGDYIFLADQDDIWKENKVETVKKYLEKNLIVVHDSNVIDNDENIVIESLFDYRKSGKGILKNIYKNTYIGCCMAFKKELKNYILPIPNNVYMHDQWIGNIGELYGNSLFIKEKLIYYRRHENNNSNFFNHLKIKDMVFNRLNFVISFLNYYLFQFKKGKKI